MKIGPVSVLLALAIGCGGHARTTRPAIESAIARQLGARFGVPVTATCGWIGTVAVGCAATFPDRTALAIAIDGRQWRVVGRVVATAPIAGYLRAELAELGRTDTVDCGSIVHTGTEPIVCRLSGGGIAFVDIGSGGTASIELALDPAVAAIRTEAPRDGELARMSHALDIAGGDEHDGDNVK